YNVQWDISQNGRNTLNQASAEILQKMDGPVTVTVYVTDQDARLGDIRNIISEFLRLYQRIKPDFTFTFIDPTEHPKVTQEAGIKVNGEMVVTFNGRSEHLTIVNEQVFTNLLIRLVRSGEKLVMGLSGHGERRLDGRANHDLGEFGKQLSMKGFKTDSLNLAIAQDVPTNASVLIIASPQVDLLKGEVDIILAYVARGGNLLWLIDQESLRGLQPLAEKLSLTLTPGVVVDPQSQQLKVPITFALGANYGQHPITRNFNNITIFPFARQISLNESKEWNSVSLVEVAQNGWVETGKLESDVTFDEMYDVAGPISIAAALRRTLQDREQHVVVIGSGHFLANSYLGNGSNLDFGINLINWLVEDENLITIQPRATLDSNLTMSKSALTVIVSVFLIILPLFFLVCGITVWWQRRRRK
ncbi:MAG: ABC transporter, partial [Betaproteobacteria bacterium]